MRLEPRAGRRCNVLALAPPLIRPFQVRCRPTPWSCSVTKIFAGLPLYAVQFCLSPPVVVLSVSISAMEEYPGMSCWVRT